MFLSRLVLFLELNLAPTARCTSAFNCPNFWLEISENLVVSFLWFRRLHLENHVSGDVKTRPNIRTSTSLSPGFLRRRGVPEYEQTKVWEIFGGSEQNVSHSEKNSCFFFEETFVFNKKTNGEMWSEFCPPFFVWTPQKKLHVFFRTWNSFIVTTSTHPTWLQNGRPLRPRAPADCRPSKFNTFFKNVASGESSESVLESFPPRLERFGGKTLVDVFCGIWFLNTWGGVALRWVVYGMVLTVKLVGSEISMFYLTWSWLSWRWAFESLFCVPSSGRSMSAVPPRSSRCFATKMARRFQMSYRKEKSWQLAVLGFGWRLDCLLYHSFIHFDQEFSSQGTSSLGFYIFCVGP